MRNIREKKMKTAAGIEEAVDKLKDNCLRPSVIRIRVLNLLMENRKHPSAKDIYRQLVKEMPTLSKTSVYNTLKLFIKKGMVSGILADDKELRYDAETGTHGHFICVRCGALHDVCAKGGACSGNIPEGFVVLEEQVYLKGYCAPCAKKGGHR